MIRKKQEEQTVAMTEEITEKENVEQENNDKKNKEKKDNGKNNSGKKKRKKAPIIIAIVVIFLLVIRVVSCALMPEAGVIVTTTSAVLGDIQESISTSGKVESEERDVLFAPVSGRLSEVHVEAGDAVKAGDVLAEYDMEDMEERLQQASLQQSKSTAVYNGIMADNSSDQAKLQEANTNLGVLDQQLKDYKSYLKDLEDKLSKSQRETNNALASESFELSQKAADLQAELGDTATTAERAGQIQKELQDVSTEQARNAYLQSIASSSDYVVSMQKEIATVQEHIAECEEYKAKMESQKSASENTVLDSYAKEQYVADKDLANLTYKQAEEEYYAAKKGVTADFDGIVTECTAVKGATVTDGMQLLTLASSSQVKVSFQASKRDVEKLELGQKAEVTISGQVYEGTVSKINRMASVNESNTPMVGVEVHLTDPDDRIILGLDAKLIVYTDKAENALLIPVEAVNADKDGDFLYVAENGIAVRKPITCGISSDTMTEVLEGITKEDQIILNVLGGTTLEEGMAVTVMPEQ